MTIMPIPTHCRFCVCGPLDYTHFICGTDYRLTRRGELCLEREARQRLDAEVERLQINAEILLRAMMQFAPDAYHQIRGELLPTQQ
jgi:hypothetical protein